MSLTFPTRQIKKAWHVGSLNPADKRRNSQEGAGLSISLHPEAWRRIARGLVSDETHCLTCPDGLFLHACRMTRIHRQAIAAWAIAEGYATAATLYRLSWTDDELEGTVSCVFASRADAETERSSDDARIHSVTGLVATDALRARTDNRADPVLVANLIATLYAEDVLRLDGTWWAERLDALVYSAPRGVIAPTQLPRWTITRQPERRAA